MCLKLIFSKIKTASNIWFVICKQVKYQGRCCDKILLCFRLFSDDENFGQLNITEIE